jgi:biopolymer transport protein ExbB
MPGVIHYLQQGDGVTQGVAILLLVMSVITWCVALGKAWMLASVGRSLPVVIDAFWRAESVDAGLAAISRRDREGVTARLAVAAANAAMAGGAGAGAGAIADAGVVGGDGIRGGIGARVPVGERVLRAVRGALFVARHRLEVGQTTLATIAGVSPFVGLLGTVWGIYHALMGVAASGQPTLADVAGPVGEALIMTALGLAVAIPAVVAYNLLGRAVRARGDELDGFARDLHVYFVELARVDVDGEVISSTVAMADEGHVRGA